MEKTKQIEITYAKSTGFDPFFMTLKKNSVIIIPTEPFAGGGFGDIYHAILFDGKKSPLQQVVKIFKDDKNEHGWRTISELQDAIITERKYAENLNQDFLDMHPGFIGFPQLIFEGRLDSRKVKGHVTVNLISIGCTPFDKILPLGDEKCNDRISFLKRKAIERMIMAYQLADCFKILHDIHYIHADITPDNIMISKTEPLCVLIDYDSGVVVKDIGDNPMTYGKPGGTWIPPEVQLEICSSGFDKININHHMDLWSIAAAIHNLIFGFPHLFLKHPTRPVYQEYAKRYPHWPDINLDDSYIEFSTNKDNYKFYRNVVFESLELSEATIREFRTTFTKGIFDSSYRTLVEVWVSRLKKEIGKEAFSNIMMPKWTEIRNLKPNFKKNNTRKKIVTKDSSESDNNTIQFQHQIEKETINNKSLVSKKHTKASTTSPSTPTKNLKDSYIEELLPDLISGKVSISMHKGYLFKFARDNGFEDEQYLKDLQDFIQLFKDSIKDKVITRLEYSSLLLQGKMLKIEKNTINKLLNPYKQN